MDISPYSASLGSDQQLANRGEKEKFKQSAQRFRKVGSETAGGELNGRGLEEILFPEQIRFRLQ